MLAGVALAGCATGGPQPSAAVDGRAVYERECLACHMRDGRGVPGMNPPLLGSPWVAGPSDALVGFVLTGGYSPDILMARFDYLSDDDLAALLTYVRAAFADLSDAVSSAQVARMRSQLQ